MFLIQSRKSKLFLSRRWSVGAFWTEKVGEALQFCCRDEAEKFVSEYAYLENYAEVVNNQ